MSVQSDDPIDWEWFTFARVRLLRELADGRTEPEIAEGFKMSYHSVRSQIEDLKEKTGCRGVRQMGRWWRENGGAWVEWCKRQAGFVG